MRLVEFTRTVPADTQISINPINVVGVDRFNSSTRIYIATGNQDGTPFVISVTDDYHAVVNSLNHAMGR